MFGIVAPLLFCRQDSLPSLTVLVQSLSMVGLRFAMIVVWNALFHDGQKDLFPVVPRLINVTRKFIVQINGTFALHYIREIEFTVWGLKSVPVPCVINAGK